MEQVDGVTSALVNRDIMLLLDREEAPERDALAKVLEPFKMQIRDMQKAPELPF
ncbi:MAG: hypothetical protein HKN82_06540 [Akkermansiaceae bacterium]|nr:hypothetical protein [Akkermansiaceae bacterium]